MVTAVAMDSKSKSCLESVAAPTPDINSITLWALLLVLCSCCNSDIDADDGGGDDGHNDDDDDDDDAGQ